MIPSQPVATRGFPENRVSSRHAVQDSASRRRREHREGKALAGLIALLTLCAALCSCTVRLVADYDEVIDNGVTELHKNTTAFLIDMETKAGTPAGEYVNNTEFYVESKAEIASLILRSDSSPKNSITTQELELLSDSFDELQIIHEAQGSEGLNGDLTAPLQTALGVHFGAILKFEIAKKRGIDG